MKYLIATIVLIVSLSSFSIAQFSHGLSYINDSTLGGIIDLKKMDIEQTSNGDLFIAYKNLGLGKYSNENLTVYNTSNSPIKSNQINCLSTDFDNVCIGTENGIALLSDGDWEFPNGYLNGYSIESVLLNSNQIFAICSKDNNIDTLAYYNGIAWSFHQFAEFDKSFTGNTPMVFHNDVLYFGTRSNGLWAFKNGNITHLLYNYNINDLEIYQNHLWISLNTYSTNEQSVFRLNLETNQLSPFSSYYAYEPTHKFKSAVFGKGENGQLNLVYLNKTNLIINTIYNNDHIIRTYPTHGFSLTKCNLTDQIDNCMYFSNWSFNSILILDINKHQSFLSGHWSENIKTLDINKVGATVKSFGSMFFDGSTLPRYEVPIDSGTNSIFASGIWIGGYDSNKNLHVSAIRYNETEESGTFVYDFAPGPLHSEGPNQGHGDTLMSIKYDRVWKIDRLDIEQFNSHKGSTNANSFITTDMEDWPGDFIGNTDQNLAPYIDYNNDGMYDPTDGDYPQILGDQMLWWIINDNTHPNEESGGQPLGVEIHNSFYAQKFDNPTNVTEDLINYQTFLNLKIVNKSTERYDSVYIGIWVDSDIGYAFDDYIGCDVEKNSFYFYNSDNYDENAFGYQGYGENPPVQTVTILNGPYADSDGVDNDLDGIVDNEEILMSKFVYYNNINQNISNPNIQAPHPATTDPKTPQHYYNYLSGKWKDNTPICYGGNGHYFGGGDINTPCNYMFPGSSDPDNIGTNGIPQQVWDETTENNTPYDRRGLCSLGPFTMEPGEINVVNVMFAHIPNNGAKSGQFNYRPPLDSLITWFNENRLPSNYEDVNHLSVNQEELPQVSMHPNPTSKNTNIISDKQINALNIYSIQGTHIKTIQVNSYKTTINTSEWEKGIYFVEIVCDHQKITQKLVVL